MEVYMSVQCTEIDTEWVFSKAYPIYEGVLISP